MKLSCRYSVRFALLGILLVLVLSVQHVPGWGEWYARKVYPLVAAPLSHLSGLLPFAVGDVFVMLSLVGIIVYPFYACQHRRQSWKHILGRMCEYLLWLYVWFYAAWGLNYSQADFYQRTSIPPVTYNAANFERFAHRYIAALNATYTDIKTIDIQLVQTEVVRGYKAIADSLGIHAPFSDKPQVKTMIYTPLASKVGVSGSMAPFFCEFTLNGDVPPLQYPATYAHELSHLLGISSEAEANFYAYQVCIRSSDPAIRFSGYFSILAHVLANARRLTTDAGYKALLGEIRPEVICLAHCLQAYWQNLYSPLIGYVQDRIYEFYLKGNKISNGQKNYSEVVKLLMSYEQWIYVSIPDSDPLL